MPPNAGFCSTCGAALGAGARFCRGCGSTLANVCGTCGAALGVDAHFCKACGAPVTRERAVPAQVAAAAKATAPAARSIRRRQVPRWIALPGVAALVAVLAGFAWMLFLRGGDDGNGPGDLVSDLQSTATVLEPPADGAIDPVNGLPLRGRTRLDHPSGATADIPGGAGLYGDAMDLRRVELAENLWWDHGGFGWEFVSFIGVPISGPATIDIPEGATSGVVIVRSQTGLWIELPSERITLADGRSGFRVMVSGVPAPWTFAVATPRAGAPGLTAEERDDLRLESLYWTDRAAWESEMTAWLKTDPLSVRIDDGRYASVQSPTPREEYERVRAQLRYTLKVFAAVRLGSAPEAGLGTALPGIPGLELTGQALWAGGVQRLAVVKQNWLSVRPTLGIESAEPNFQVEVYFFDEWVETTMHQYAPWGVEFVKGLLDAGQLRDFDIRVLKPYGELKWIDILLDASEVPADIRTFIEAEMASGPQPLEGAPRMQWSLRLYGVRAMERLAMIDWLKQNVDWVVRWLPVALAAMGLIPGAVGLSFAFAFADQIINWVGDWYTGGGQSPYAFMVMEGLSAGGLGGASFLIDMAEERVLMQEAGRGMLPAHGLTIAQFAYSVGMFAAVRGTDYYMFKSIRELAEGTRGYCHESRCDSITGGVPPVMLHARGTGLAAQPKGAYPTFVDRLSAYRLRLGEADYHTQWKAGIGTPHGRVADLSFEKYGAENWPTVVTKTQPQAQAIRLAIPKAAIPAEAWGNRPADTPLEDLGAVLTLSAPSGESASFTLREEAAKLVSDKADMFYATVLLQAPGERRLNEEEISWLQDGFEPRPDHQEAFAGGAALVREITGQLSFPGGKSEPLAVTVALDRAPQRAYVRSTSDDFMPENRVIRVHYGTAAVSAGFEGIYDLVHWEITSANPDLLRVYNEGHLFSFERSCEASMVCTFEVYHLDATATAPARDRAAICGPETDGARFCTALADSRPYEPSSGLLPPLKHDNFFSLVGSVLTGSDDVGSHGNPGEPAVINHWHEVRAEFKDGGQVSGTLTAAQLVWDVVDGKQVNAREIFLTVAFEAVKRK